MIYINKTAIKVYLK